MNLSNTCEIKESVTRLKLLKLFSSPYLSLRETDLFLFTRHHYTYIYLEISDFAYHRRKTCFHRRVFDEYLSVADRCALIL